MVRTNVLCQLGMGLMLSLAAAFAGAGARADAETESPFFLYPPAGWAREVSQDGTVTYYDPETPNYCAIRIAPVIPKNLAVDDFWLLRFFDTGLRHQLEPYARHGISVPYDAEPPVFRKGSIGTYVYKELSINTGVDMINHQYMLAFKDGRLQKFLSVSDVTRCPHGPVVSKQFFGLIAGLLDTQGLLDRLGRRK